jgi:TPR repeat protein
VGYSLRSAPSCEGIGAEKIRLLSHRELQVALLFKERNGHTLGRVGAAFGSKIGHPIETYLKAAQEGFVAAQFIVGLAHLEGYCAEKSERSAYYWLKMAAENSSQLKQSMHRSGRGA